MKSMKSMANKIFHWFLETYLYLISPKINGTTIIVRTWYLQKSMRQKSQIYLRSPKINEIFIHFWRHIMYFFHWFLNTHRVRHPNLEFWMACYSFWFSKLGCRTLYKIFFLIDFWRHIGSYHLPPFLLLRVLSTHGIRNLLIICFKGGSLLVRGTYDKKVPNAAGA